MAEGMSYYIYGILNTPGYQGDFLSPLLDDFLRIPLTPDYDAFAKMAERGHPLNGYNSLTTPI